MTGEETRAYKAKQLRYKKPIVRDLNLASIQSEIWEMMEVCTDIHWYDNDEESLVNALNGDEDEAFGFKMDFTDLEAELEMFQSDLNDIYVGEYFDLLFPAVGADYAGGFLGYDEYEGDYFGLQPYEYDYAEDEAAKKLMRLTKKELLDVVGQCLKIVHSYIGIRYRYDCLEAAIEILRGENMDRIKAVKGIEEQYLIADKSSDGFKWKYDKEVQKLDNMLQEIPPEYWIQ